MKALEGYFDTIAAAAASKKLVLEQLVANNAKVADTNEELMAIVKQISTKIRISNKRPTASRKRAAERQHKGRGNQSCSPISKRKAIMIMMPVLN